jgi:uncharacterized protein YegL
MIDVEDAFRLEENKWANWRAAAERDRDEELAKWAAICAKTGCYLSGGRLKKDLEIIFACIDEVVIDGVALRAKLSAENAALAEPGNIAPLRSKMADFINKGVSQMDQHVLKTFRELGSAGREEILRRARLEAKAILDRVTNDLEAIRLELKLNPKKEDLNSTTIITGNSGVINFGSVMGDLNNSVQTLNQEGERGIADAIEKLGDAIKESAELNDATRRDYLEHLVTVGEQVAKPPEQRRMATFTNAIGNLASIATVALKVAPAYHELIRLLTDHHIL